MMNTAYPIDEQAHKLLPKRGSTGPRYHGNTYQIDSGIYDRAQSGAIFIPGGKPMSRRDRIRLKLQPKNRHPLNLFEWNRYCQSQKA